MQKKTQYTNMNTGEYAEKISYVDMQFDDDKGFLFWINKSSVKSFIDIPLPKAFNWAEKGRINELKHFILRDNQLLVYRSNDSIKPLTYIEMAKILELSDRKTKELIKKMKLFSIIKEISIDGIKYFAFNPIYGLKSKRISLHVFMFFQQELKDVLPGWAYVRFIQQASELNPNIKIVR